jgi:hypothetical protein
MLKTHIHKDKYINKSKGQKNIIQIQYIYQKRIVVINKLLNRVRMDKRSEKKKKIIFYSLSILSLSLFSTLIVTIK